MKLHKNSTFAYCHHCLLVAWLFQGGGNAGDDTEKDRDESRIKLPKVSKIYLFNLLKFSGVSLSIK